MPLKRELDAVVTQMHSAGVSYDEAVRHFKRRYLLEVLTRHKGNQCKAADELGMHRNTLSRTLAELEMTKAQIRMGMRRPPSSERPKPLEQPMRVNERIRSFGGGVNGNSAERSRMQAAAGQTVHREAQPTASEKGSLAVRMPRPLR